MKVGSGADYTVRVRERGWDAAEAQAALYEGIYTVELNQVVDVSFVPAVVSPGPPWSLAGLPEDRDEFTTAQQARLFEILTASYAVTPDDERAGTWQQLEWPFAWPPEDSFLAPADDDPKPTPTVFFVTAAEFRRITADLAELTAIAGSVQSMVRHSELTGHAAVRFVDQQILGSPALQPRHAASVGKRAG